MQDIFNSIRRVTVFILGVFVIIDGFNDKTDTLGKLIIGAIMVGILPLDDLLPWKKVRSRPSEDTTV